MITSVQFVAEVSSNHHRDLDRCLDFINVAARIGCNAIKFQLFRIKELFSPEILEHSDLHRSREKWELPVDFLPDLAGRCRELQMQFSCTPFYLGAVEQLFPYVAFYKIASYELLWDELLRACAATGKPIVLSTGMATLDEVRRAVTVLRDAGCIDLTLLHCVSGYPTPISDCNLSTINTLRTSFGCPVGWSDHSVQAGVLYRAIHCFDAHMVEFHLDLDGQGDEFKSGHCWLPDQIQSVIETVNTGFQADGNGEKIPASSELPDREWRADPSDGLRPFLSVRKEWIL